MILIPNIVEPIYVPAVKMDHCINPLRKGTGLRLVSTQSHSEVLALSRSTKLGTPIAWAWARARARPKIRNPEPRSWSVRVVFPRASPKRWSLLNHYDCLILPTKTRPRTQPAGPVRQRFSHRVDVGRPGTAGWLSIDWSSQSTLWCPSSRP